MPVKPGGETHRRFAKYYSLLTPEIFCERFGYKSPAVVRQIASVLKVTRKPKPKACSEAEIKELTSKWHLRGYHTHTNIRRSRGAILVKAKRLRRETTKCKEAVPA